jgi:FkbM family methyltransferase
MKSLLKKFLASRGKEVAPLGTMRALNEASLVTRALASLIEQSHGQLRQDLFVLCELGFKRGGYFVEFGGADGVLFSNTLLLERQFGWTGIIAEPARRWQPALSRNRRCHIETDCVWRDSTSTFPFTETDLAEFSTIASYRDSDLHASYRETGGRTYDVNTISLNDLLAKYEAPTHIDYLSIDTEGSEFDILECFDFSRYEFRVITCEHNYSPMREKLLRLLGGHGYERKFAGLTQFDDWYVKA